MKKRHKRNIKDFARILLGFVVISVGVLSLFIFVEYLHYVVIVLLIIPVIAICLWLLEWAYRIGSVFIR